MSLLLLSKVGESLRKQKMTDFVLVSVSVPLLIRDATVLNIILSHTERHPRFNTLENRSLSDTCLFSLTRRFGCTAEVNNRQQLLSLTEEAVW